MPPDEPIGAPPPTFDALKLSAEVRKAVDELGYVHPTPVQVAVFDPVTRGADVLVQARTGTGKTAAYGLPIIDAVVKRSVAQVQALILCPTRELALQVARELEGLSKYRGTKVAAVYGGAPMGAQIQKIQDGAQIVSGTPGRVLDHLRRGTLDPKGLRVVVLDESDEMLSMGFLPQIDEILSHLPASRQSLMFSATLPPDVQRLAGTRLKNPEMVTLSGDGVGALEIAHFVYLTVGDKIQDLLQILEVENPESAIVFCNTRDSTKRVASALQQQGFDADWLNADLAQNEREKVMAATRSSQLRFLVATDVAARGIDISHLTHVINYDLPDSAENYVHRTGRTGRAGRTGTAISLIEPGDIGNLYMLRLTYKIRPVEKQLPTRRDIKTRAEMDVVQMFADLFAKQPAAHPDDLALARRLLTHEGAERIVAGLLRDHLGARPSAPDQASAARRAAPPKPAPAAPPAPPPLTGAGASSDPPTERRPRPGMPAVPAAPVPVPVPAPVPGIPAVPAAPVVSTAPAAPVVSAAPAAPAAPRDRRQVLEPTTIPPNLPGARRAPAHGPNGAAHGPLEKSSPGAPATEASPNVAVAAATATAATQTPRASTSTSTSEAVTPPPEAAAREPRRDGRDVRRDRPRRDDRGPRADDRGPGGEAQAPRADDRGPGGEAQAPRAEEREPRGEARAPRDTAAADGDAAPPPRSPDGVEIYVNVGRRDGVKASDFYSLLQDRAGVTIDDTEYVNVRQRNTFIGIKRGLADKALVALDGATIAGREAKAEPSRDRS